MAIKSFLTASILTLASLASALPAPPAADCSAAPPAPPAPSGAPAPGVPKPAAAAKISCPVVFSGQIPKAAKLTDFDSAATSLFNPNNVKGNDTWSQILLFPTSADSARFDDAAAQKPLEVTLNDRSIFKTQFGFRRAGLLFKNDTNTQGAGNTGVKTLHWSVKQDPARPLNLTHEYLNVWHEAGDFSGNQFNFEAGTLIGQETVGPADTFKFLNRKNELIFQTPIDKTGKWQGFAVTLDFDKNTLQIFYSPDPATPLKAVLPAPVANDNSGFGQFQMGMLKKPTGDTSDVVNKGTQEAGINEGQIYGGIFLEDSANGCISL